MKRRWWLLKWLFTLTMLLVCSGGLSMVVSAEEDLSAKCGLIAPVGIVDEEFEYAASTVDDAVVTAADTAYWKKFTNNYYYNQLSDAQRNVWDELERQCIAVAVDDAAYVDAIRVSATGAFSDEDAVGTFWCIFKYSNPQYYFLRNQYGWSYQTDESIAGITLQIYDDFMSGEARGSATKAFCAKVDDWVSQVRAGQREEDKVKLAHDIVAENTVYDYDTIDDPLNQSVYSMVCTGKTVCAGYAAALQLLLNPNGIQTTEVTSSTHAWNNVKLHGYWYVVDVTWDDGSNNNIYYDYYLKSGQTVLSSDQLNSHVTEGMWNGYLPELRFDSLSSGQYTSSYFQGDDYVYFKVNDNASLDKRYALAVDVQGTASMENVPQIVMYGANEYDVLNGSEPDSGDNTPSEPDSGDNTPPEPDSGDNTPSEVLNGWVVENGIEYWYENGIKQGTEGRGKEIYDPGTDAWYWLDAVDGGKKAVSKDVYQESKADDAGTNGKWVRYDENGHMIKGWDTNKDGTYYFDPTYGTMAKGNVVIDRLPCYFDEDTGIGANKVWITIDGIEYWYENGMRQGYDPNNAAYRGKEIYDPASKAWYWLDNVDKGKKAVSKDVYQESEAGTWAENSDGTGKWVRYDAQGHMIKGWDEKNGDKYYFDYVYGTMARGGVTIDGKLEAFDEVRGVYEGELANVIGAYEAEVVRLVNEERTSRGLQPLDVKMSLQCAAETRANELITAFSHDRPNGTSCFTILDEYEIPFQRAGENIAAGYGSPQAVVQGWMNSSGHRANILNEDFTHIGVGYTYSNNAGYGHYWVQLFIRKK